MLVSFRVENFLSVGNRVELSMIAVDHDTSLPGNIITTQLNRSRPRPVRLLKSAVLYGPNASGKTNLLKAIKSFSGFVRAAIQNTGNPIPFVPFALDPVWKTRPSAFEISLIEKGTLYRYGLSADTVCVHHEYLYATDKAGERKIFERTKENAAEHYTYGPAGRNLKKFDPFVRPDSLLLAVGASYNNADCRMAWDRIGQMASTGIDIHTRKMGLPDSIKTTEKADLFSEIVKYLGFGFSGLSIRHPEGWRGGGACGETPRPEILFVYTDSAGREVLLDEATQSDGTLIFINLFADILSASKGNGGLLLLDEIESSLHPLLCDALFGFVHALPSDNVQLLCTTHNTQLLNAAVFRRDQIWLTEKNRGGETDLYSLADFKDKPRKDARWGKQYLEGRFGGLPILNTARVEEIFSRYAETSGAVP